MMGTTDVWAVAGRIFHPGRSHGCCPVRATVGSLPCGHYWLAPVTGNKKESNCLMVLRVKPTPTRFPTSTLAFMSSMCHPCGFVADVRRIRKRGLRGIYVSVSVCCRKLSCREHHLHCFFNKIFKQILLNPDQRICWVFVTEPIFFKLACCPAVYLAENCCCGNFQQIAVAATNAVWCHERRFYL